MHQKFQGLEQNNNNKFDATNEYETNEKSRLGVFNYGLANPTNLAA